MDPTDPARNGMTRRNFMKKSALTAGAISVLGRGTGFAYGDGISGDPLFVHLWDEKSSGLNLSITVAATGQIDAQLNAIAGIWDAVPGDPIPHYEYVTNTVPASGIEIDPVVVNSVTDNGDGTYTVVFEGPLTVKKHFNKPV